MKRGLGIFLAVLAAIAIFFVLLAGWGVSHYNKLVTLRENIDGAWAQVDNQLKRRNDLIPNLVNTVKGYAAHEKEIFIKIAEARAKLAGAQTIPEKIQGAQEMGSALGRLLVIVERYPELKANESFNRLMDELAGTENRLAVERMRYNDVVKEYNTTIGRFPDRIFAGLFGFEKGVYYQVPEEEKRVPKVEF
ncbi:MAG: LemA family protein [bacterium]